MSDCVKLWRKDLHKINPKAAESLADPGQYKNLFPNFDAALQVEAAERASRGRPRPASAYAQYAGSNMRDLIEEMGSMGLEAEPRLNGTAEGHYAQPPMEDVDAAPLVDEAPVFVRCVRAALVKVAASSTHRLTVRSLLPHHHRSSPRLARRRSFLLRRWRRRMICWGWATTTTSTWTRSWPTGRVWTWRMMAGDWRTTRRKKSDQCCFIFACKKPKRRHGSLSSK